jgi:hypothetical protein
LYCKAPFCNPISSTQTKWDPARSLSFIRKGRKGLSGLLRLDKEGISLSCSKMNYIASPFLTPGKCNFALKGFRVPTLFLTRFAFWRQGGNLSKIETFPAFFSAASFQKGSSWRRMYVGVLFFGHPLENNTEKMAASFA